jgi:hypothetical protein
MSKKHYDRLVKSAAAGKPQMPGTGETMTSPNREFSEDYDGVLVRFEVKPGTTAQLEAIGVRGPGPVVEGAYPAMPSVDTARTWNQNNALFKQEPLQPGDIPQVNIGLGKGPALDIFNDNIVSFTPVSGG